MSFRIQRILPSQGQDSVYLKIESGMALLVLYSKTGTPLALTIQGDSPSDMEQVFAKVFEDQKGLDSFKLIGSEFLVDQISTFLISKNLQSLKLVRESKSFEIFFWPKEGRLKMATAGQEGPTPHRSARKIRTLIVDDSKTIQNLLTKILSADPQIEVIGAVGLPSEAMKFIERERLDVVTLDIHMPEMNGVELLKKYIVHYPIPTVMISAISKEEGPEVLMALEAGAVDYVKKPTLDELHIVEPLIRDKVKSASEARVKRSRAVSAGPVQRLAIGSSSGGIDYRKIVAIGSSTGGTEALKEVLTRLPEKIPPIVIVQHIPPVFSAALAKRLASLCPFEVKEAVHGDEVRENRVLIAPGGTQMSLVRKGQTGGLIVKVDAEADPVNRHKPSVDVLFDSVAELVGKNAVGVMLTGMGSDGSVAMKKMKDAGAFNLAQDEATCVVYGMPAAAVRAGGVDQILPLHEISEGIFRALGQSSKQSPKSATATQSKNKGTSSAA